MTLAVGTFGPPGSSFRNDTCAPISGSTRASLLASAMRTFTVALARSAVGMVAMTSPGMVQSEYALSFTTTGCPACTRLMKFSLTSTSTSSESMSTIVPMPVRVKPPPADMGDTISPTCAAFSVTTPENGAREAAARGHGRHVSSDLSRLLGAPPGDRCANARIVETAAGNRQTRLGGIHLPLRDGQRRPAAVVGGLGGVERLRADDPGRLL